MTVTKKETTETLIQLGATNEDIHLFFIDVGDKEEYTREEVEEWYTGMSAIDKLERIYENSI